MAWRAQRGVAKRGSERGHLAAMNRRAPREGARRPQLWLREKAGEEGIELTCVCGLKYDVRMEGQRGVPLGERWGAAAEVSWCLVEAEVQEDIQGLLNQLPTPLPHPKPVQS